ncbi:MAG: hydrogenase formation protein HypD [Endomicrobiia bacterium]
MKKSIDLSKFQDKKICNYFLSEIKKLVNENLQTITIMEVCGTHTMAIFRSGIRAVLPQSIKLISGPGCPVCVTSQEYIDKAIAYSRAGFIITTFGDMFRVPGSDSSLEKESSKGADVRIVYSPYESIKIAKDNPDKRVIFLSVGFETTTPTIALTLLEAKKIGLKNWFLLCGNKLIPPAMKILAESPELKIDGFICPGHVSTVIGSKPYRFISEKYGIPCVITGFEPTDIFEGIFMLVKQLAEKRASVEVQYRRSVKPEGNPNAVKVMFDVFGIVDSNWRGIGIIPKSGLKLKKEYSEFDIEKVFDVEFETKKEPKGCICGEILKGIKNPTECLLFRKVCNPENPVGACMVSSEGTCSAYYKYM